MRKVAISVHFLNSPAARLGCSRALLLLLHRWYVVERRHGGIVRVVLNDLCFTLVLLVGVLARAPSGIGC